VKDLIIRVYRVGHARPDATLRIPGGMLRLASKLLPRQAVAALAEHGIEVEKILELARDPEVEGTLLEIEDHNKGRKFEVALQ